MYAFRDPIRPVKIILQIQQNNGKLVISIFKLITITDIYNIYIHVYISDTGIVKKDLPQTL